MKSSALRAHALKTVDSMPQAMTAVARSLQATRALDRHDSGAA
jgi:hypothetical protein